MAYAFTTPFYLVDTLDGSICGIFILSLSLSLPAASVHLRATFLSYYTALASSSPIKERDYTLNLPSLLMPLNSILPSPSAETCRLSFDLLLRRHYKVSRGVILSGDWKLSMVLETMGQRGENGERWLAEPRSFSLLGEL